MDPRFLSSFKGNLASLAESEPLPEPQLKGYSRPAIERLMSRIVQPIRPESQPSEEAYTAQPKINYFREIVCRLAYHFSHMSGEDYAQYRARLKRYSDTDVT